jgi:hypothetical protein
MDQFHLGIVTADIEATKEALNWVFGYRWGPEIGGKSQVELSGGLCEVSLRCAYSVTEPRLEVIRAIPDTLWEPVAGSGIHHLGYWSDDVAADAAALESHGYVVEAMRRGPDGQPFFAFYRSDKGFRVELLSRTAEPSLRPCWTATEVQA